MADARVMQALGLVRILKKQNFNEISFNKISECKKMGLGRFYLRTNRQHEEKLIFVLFSFFSRFSEISIKKNNLQSNFLSRKGFH